MWCKGGGWLLTTGNDLKIGFVEMFFSYCFVCRNLTPHFWGLNSHHVISVILVSSSVPRHLSDLPLFLFAVCSCCGAGTAADTEKTTDMLSSNLTIFSLNSGRKPRVIMAVNILQDMLYRLVRVEAFTELLNPILIWRATQALLKQENIFQNKIDISGTPRYTVCMACL